MTSVVYTNGNGHAHAAAPDLERFVHPLRRTPIQRILLVTDGTVTEILEAYTGESMRLIKLYEELVTLDQDLPELEVGHGERVISRRILLQGKMSLTNFLYAESFLAIDRLAEPLRRGLLESYKPIGFLIQEQRMETFREIVDCGREMAGNLGSYFDVPDTAAIIWRTYRIFAGGRPIMLITEKFPETHFPA